MDSSNISWHCLKCGLPNLSSSFFNSTFSVVSNNSFSSLSNCESPGLPSSSSSPKPLQSFPRPVNQNNIPKKINHPLKVTCLNFQSIKNKKPELENLLDSVNPDIIIGTETWLDPSVSSSEYFDLNTYSVFRKDRPPNSKGQYHGGVLIAIKNEYQSVENKELQTDCESVWVEAIMHDSRKLVISSFYRPQPNDNTSLQLLNDSINRINTNSKSILLIGGDFNLGNIDWDTCSTMPGKPNIKQHQELLDIVADHSLTQLVKSPTRKDKTLDLLLTNYPSVVDNIETIPPIGEADHDIILCECRTSLRRCKPKPRPILKYSKANWNNINEDLIKTNSEISQKEQYCSDINELWNIFKENLQKSISKNIPSKLSKAKNKFPWITNDLRKKMNRYKRKLLKRNKNHAKSNDLRLLKSQIQKEQRKAYWSYIENMIFNIPIPDESSGNFNKPPKNLFSYIKGQKTDSTTIPPLRKDGLLKTDAIPKANILNQQFQKAFTPTSSQEIPNKGSSPFPQMSNIHITQNGINKLLSNINPHKASGPDGIHGKVLKECKDNISPILTIIFNKSLELGKLPLDWKHANICPVYKKGDKHDAINYRPISLTCICCKIMEHVISSNIMSFLETNNILYDLQHGFRSSRSCETQLISFIQNICQSLNKKIQTDIIIMDFAKAFDKVPHKHLLYKLNYYGINNTTVNWISDFLGDRTQTVALEGIMSEKVPVTSGVPQGTVMGPILFLIYINDFADYIQHSTLRLFADDSIIYKEINNENDAKLLQSDLEAAGRWETDWLMHFHPDKCNILSITQKKNPINFLYKLHNHDLEKVQSAKYLGVTIQNNLKWDKHINSITNKANQSLGFLRRNLKINSSKAKDHAYKAIVRPKLEYSSSVWDPHTKCQKDQIEKVQRRAARFTTNRFHNTSSVSNMIHSLNWPSLEIRRTRARLIMFYKIIHQNVAIYPVNLLFPADPRTRYSSIYGYKIISTTTDQYKYSFFPRTVSQWNLLPLNMQQADTVDSFKSMVTVPVLVATFMH